MRDIRIVIAQRGWVFVGEFERQGNHIVLHKGATIRRFGTSGDGRGLGSLAAKGPTDETHLEPFELPFEMLELTAIGMHTCNADVWAPVLNGLVVPE